MVLLLPRRPARDRARRGAPAAAPRGPLELRPATPGDGEALRALAQRDSTELPEGPLLIAEVAGLPIAAIALEDGVVVADPFWPTTAAVAALRAAAPAPRRRRAWPRPGRRRRAAARGRPAA